LIFYFIDKLYVKPLELSSFNKYFMLKEDEKERYYLSNLSKYIFFMRRFKVYMNNLY